MNKVIALRRNVLVADRGVPLISHYNRYLSFWGLHLLQLTHFGHSEELGSEWSVDDLTDETRTLTIMTLNSF